MKRLIVALLLLSNFAFAAPAKQITSPTEAFGFQPGTDRKLADWKELTAYYQKLSTESDRIRYEEVGKTTEGRPFVVLTISAAENLANLDHYLEIQKKLADPRLTTPDEAKKLIAEGKTILAVTANIHSTEIASSQSAAEFAYRLATDDSEQTQRILHNVIIVLVPSLNPDGQQLVVDWYKKYLGTPYEGSGPTVVWHHYVGHDNNRDWATFSLAETRLAVQVLNKWHPQILYDIHQMGANGPRIYLPPWVDPIDPNVDPLLVSSMNALGENTALEIAQTGKKGILVHGVYDFWSPLRDYIALHNGLRVLTESASVNIASPINIPYERLDRGIGYDAKVSTWNYPDPWKGGEWHLRDIVDYQLDAFFSIANNAALFRERYLSNFYTIGRHAIERTDWPYAYVIPAEQLDVASVARLVNTLRTGNVEVQQATADFEARGHRYAKGSYIVRLAQPFGAFAKTVLEIQHYPNIPEYPGGPLQRPYDVTAQTLPLLFGVKADEIQQSFEAASAPVDHAKVDAGVFKQAPKAAGYTIDDHTNSSLYALFALLGDGVKAYRLTGPNSDPGTIYIPKQLGVEKKLTTIAERFPIEIDAVTATPAGGALEVRLPRIALYQSWVPSMDEGWTRLIFDQNHIPYTRVVDADIRNGNLNQRFDVVILPDNAPRAITTGRGGWEDVQVLASASGAQIGAKRSEGREASSAPKTPPEFTGGLGNAGVASLKSFADNGGTIVALNKASLVYTAPDASVQNALSAANKKDFYIPGSILEVSVDPTHPIAFGAPRTVPIFFEQSPFFNIKGDARSIASYAGDNPLLSGWILGGQYLKSTSAIVDEPSGKGHIILFGFRPQYRAQSEVTYKFFFNSLLYSSSTAVQTVAAGGKR
jgi:hypothetical protein